MDSLAALKLYQEVFGVACVEATALQRGENEVVFTLHGARFHMLDQNEQFQLKAPEKGMVLPVWFNMLVEDIHLYKIKKLLPEKDRSCHLMCTHHHALPVLRSGAPSAPTKHTAFGAALISPFIQA